MKPTCPKCGGSLDSDRHRYCALNRTEADIASSGNVLRLPECGHCKALDAVADAVLAHKPKAKSKPARKRARRAKKIAKDTEGGKHD